MLSREQVRQFQREGFLALANFLPGEVCDRLRQRAETLVADYRLDTARVFSTTSPKHERDRYFFASGRKIAFFLEEEALGEEDGRLRVPKDQAINKIGHGLHLEDPLYRDFATHPRLRDLLASIPGMTKPQCVQSMFIFKQAKIGGEVICHQDSTYIQTQPDTTLGLWFALEDATKDNGCLWGIPSPIAGTQGKPPRARFNLQVDSRGNPYGETVVNDPTPWDISQAQALEIAKGGLVLLNGTFPHFSLANRSERTRHAFTLHYVSGDSHFLPSNWLPAPDY